MVYQVVIYSQRHWSLEPSEYGHCRNWQDVLSAPCRVSSTLQISTHWSERMRRRPITKSWKPMLRMSREVRYEGECIRNDWPKTSSPKNHLDSKHNTSMSEDRYQRHLETAITGLVIPVELSARKAWEMSTPMFSVEKTWDRTSLKPMLQWTSPLLTGLAQLAFPSQAVGVTKGTRNIDSRGQHRRRHSGTHGREGLSVSVPSPW